VPKISLKSFGAFNKRTPELGFYPETEDWVSKRYVSHEMFLRSDEFFQKQDCRLRYRLSLHRDTHGWRLSLAEVLSSNTCPYTAINCEHSVGHELTVKSLRVVGQQHKCLTFEYRYLKQSLACLSLNIVQDHQSF